MPAHIFYPENVPRADRLQMLINHIAIIQTDVGREKQRMDELDKKAKETLNLLLERGEVKSLDQLNAEAMARLTDEQRQEYQALIDSTKEVGQVTNILLWAGLVLGGEQIIRYGSPVLMSLARGVAALQGVQGGISALVGAAGKLATGAAAAGEGLAAAAQQATQTVARSSAAGAAAVAGESGAAAGAATDAVAETTKLTKPLGWIGKYGKWLSRLGVVLLLAVPLIEVIYGRKQKEQLIEGIHDTQVARLVIAALREQARKVTNEMNSIKSYLEILKKGKVTAAAEVGMFSVKITPDYLTFGEELLQTIRSSHAQIDLTTIERELRADDKGDFHKSDDLAVENVVLAAIKESTKAA
ncbi:hypothetical protein DXG03_007803 [Asterophora parasitica]|uniref:Uncharacterized protein n=1 Tax=Asterophora parasitica TaxID=117018 RepID=A0A9P7KFU9_9AGAR|nr:hypothetical protein DXG03_007803 [Asterophora parasitica]